MTEIKYGFDGLISILDNLAKHVQKAENQRWKLTHENVTYREANIIIISNLYPEIMYSRRDYKEDVNMVLEKFKYILCN